MGIVSLVVARKVKVGYDKAMAYDRLIDDLMESDWDDDEDLQDDLAASRIWKANQFLSWFGDVAGVSTPSLGAFAPLQVSFLCDQCESLIRVCSHVTMSGYLSHVGTSEPSVFGYLSYLNDPGRYKETEVEIEP